ncbi:MULTISPECIES: Imm1 family immunity protein [Prauserella salsuginis group]|uniref:Imm1 family immunity protein n=1 Tax=Prauserella salsuginis TaxID=387889 RepID=A0ABW6G5N6_9PSEU|nr:MULTISPECIES: Imm1 family immunity protein [Prauserella salsuginis group]
MHDVATVDDTNELLRVMAQAGHRPARRRGRAVRPRADDRMLIVGIRGDRGCLVWADWDTMLVPADGVNTEPIDYFTWDGHHHPQEAGAEAPVETMHRVVGEFVVTGQRPTCIQWAEDRS